MKKIVLKICNTKNEYTQINFDCFDEFMSYLIDYTSVLDCVFAINIGNEIFITDSSFRLEFFVNSMIEVEHSIEDTSVYLFEFESFYDAYVYALMIKCK